MSHNPLANPLLNSWAGPLGLPPFADIEPAHFSPAFDQAMVQHRAELDLIAAQAAPPTFENTVAAFDRSGRLLARIEPLFDTLAASVTSADLQAAQMRLAAPLAAHRSAVYMHGGLFARIDALHCKRQALGLTPEQLRLLERVHLDFARAGAQLAPAAQTRYAHLMGRLAELNTQFAQNVLAEESRYQLLLTDAEAMAGLPGFVRAAAAQAAQVRGLPVGAQVITLSRSLIVPFLTFSTRRDLRELAWQAWISRGEHAGPHDNRAIAQEILSLRNEQARLHGHASYADYALADRMAGTPAAVADLLNRVWTPALAAAAVEQDALRDMMASLGHNHVLEAWDWRFYAEKVRAARYDLDDAEVKPYFSLDAMVNAMFDCARRLFGLEFVARPDVAAYHPDARVYEVRDAAGEMRGIFIQDNFARPTKRSGAWMNALRWQSKNQMDALPIILNNNNFAKALPGEPTLLGFDDARTLFHEFGHGLHGLLSDVSFERLSGTQVLSDFAELPSKIFEHWITEPEVLKQHARHYQTGAPIPDALLAKLHAARLFGLGYETVRYTASALVDMAAHALTDTDGPDVAAFEAATVAALGLPSAVGMNHRMTHFQHLFSGSGYAAGYYVYLWAEVLDCDGYEAFVEAGSPFDAAVAARLRTFIYSSGNSREPGAAFRDFRGRDPNVEPMLRDRGLLLA